MQLQLTKAWQHQANLLASQERASATLKEHTLAAEKQEQLLLAENARVGEQCASAQAEVTALQTTLADLETEITSAQREIVGLQGAHTEALEAVKQALHETQVRNGLFLLTQTLAAVPQGGALAM